MSVAEVRIWGTRVGAVSREAGQAVASFEYDPAFAAAGFELSPLRMPVEPNRIYRFPALAEASFSGLPGMLADSLPDLYGNALIDAWLAAQDRQPESFDAIERLSYVGQRGMGALEYAPSTGPNPTVDELVDLDSLRELAAEVLARRGDLVESLNQPSRQHAVREILRVGTSAGGARAKALIALNPETEEVRSGQLDLPQSFEYWILKFDGVDDDSRDLGSSRGYGAIEYVYAQMAGLAGIDMAPSRMLEEGDRRHFMTRRFDRGPDGDKLHMQSLGGLAHLDFRLAGANSYEQALQTIQQLGLGVAAAEEQFRRMVFNLVGRNQDDHVKNIAFLMNRAGEWSLSPAFDVVYAYNPEGAWTARHQMSINGKRDDFTLEDLREVARLANLKRGSAERILDEVTAAIGRWPELAAEAGIDEARIEAIAATLRLELRRR